MRATVFDRYGDPDVMNLREVPVPEVQEGEVLIRVGYAGVNPSDSKTRSGQSARAGYRYREVNFPFVTGLDAAGIVERIGSNVTEFSQGDRVITWRTLPARTGWSKLATSVENWFSRSPSFPPDGAREVPSRLYSGRQQSNSRNGATPFFCFS
jgi:NADPH:quinone reductase-like Zn-dependent oxidoreductase